VPHKSIGDKQSLLLNNLTNIHQELHYQPANNIQKKTLSEEGEGKRSIPRFGAAASSGAEPEAPAPKELP